MNNNLIESNGDTRPAASLVIPFRLNVIKPHQIGDEAVAAKALASNLLPPCPQLAYDPKLANDYELLYNYACKQFKSSTFLAEEKLDGVRCQFVVTSEWADGSVTLSAKGISRASRELASVVHICDELAKSTYLTQWFKREYDVLLQAGHSPRPLRLVLDSELRIAFREFRYINGVVNRKTCDEETARLTAHVFQVYSLDRLGRCIYTFTRAEVDRLFANSEFTNLVRVPFDVVDSISKLALIAERGRACGHEGLILKSALDYRHHDGRSKQWLKLKFRQTGTFRLIGRTAGEGKYLGSLGALLIEDCDGNTSLIGTGFTDEERRELNSLDLVNHHYYVAVSYMTRTGDSLREGSFEGLREDLTDADLVVVDRFLNR